MSARRISIFDTTLRDGEQSPGCSMNVHEKLRMAFQLQQLGVDIIEAGFPVSSDGDFEAVKLLAENVRGTKIAALARCKTEDIARAWEALQWAASPRIHLFLATSDIHLAVKLKITREDAFNKRVRQSPSHDRCAAMSSFRPRMRRDPMSTSSAPYWKL